MEAVASVLLADALALFDGRKKEVAGEELRRGSIMPSTTRVTVGGFAASEVDGYATRALRGLLEVVTGGSPELFELR